MSVSTRQVHLDFHTSPFISDVGTEFDAHAFAATFKRARVNSVTIFAKCHHGMCYYPTKTGKTHPAIGDRDLLGEMIEALHREDIRCPVYTPIAWEENVAHLHPEWLQMRADGTFARCNNVDPARPPHPGGWLFNDWVNPDFQDYIEAHVCELFERYGSLDGLFFDILFYDHLAHYSDASRAYRRRHGFAADDAETFKRFESHAQACFAERFSKLVRDLSPKSTIFYNTPFDVFVDGTGGRQRLSHCTHIEIESLPSGFWGYHHFPRLARGAGRWGKQWIGMTGRFQRMWGDFGGIKPQAALEYECFRSQALGGGNSIGDQLPPRGRLDAAAYDLIGAVYAQCEAADPFYQGSSEITNLGVISANHPKKDLAETGKSDEGAIQMCEEVHYEVSLLDDASDLSVHSALILPDDVVVTPVLYKKLKAFHAAGGQLVLSFQSGCDAAGHWALDFLPLTFEGKVEKFPTYWRAREAFWLELSASDRVVYSQGLNVKHGSDVEVLVDRVLPYFKRTDLTFSSHFQTPPQADSDRFPAVLAGEGFIYFADPIFREYRQTGNQAVRDVWRRVLRDRVGPPPVGDGLPTTILCAARRRERELLITLLHYIPLRKALEIDVCEERISFADEVLRLQSSAKEVRIFGTDETLATTEDGTGWVLPSIKGRLLLEVPDYFSS
ncbi:alpha-L-fucosidase [Coraliomargarita algicola]|uniref:Alpha-L-fucosidase n=1 Tax=Coraliomargarita algicola TaxID=3092156 RepID=A0ABZ0RJ50_9BACT|nr:alpha-L-fucosidase [Coraliomargarita sp. J2-16]WPJ95108.1 alpha-L-fucosidase [Coraliomargarita sp. J2-16]